MEKFRWKEFRDEGNESEALRAILIPNALVEFDDGETERLDTWFWFYGAIDYDRWFAFGMSGLEFIDPNEVTEDVDLDECRKLALYIGTTWDAVISQCPHCVANRNRSEALSLDPETWDALQSSTDEDIIHISTYTQFAAMADVVEEASGIKLSLN